MDPEVALHAATIFTYASGTGTVDEASVLGLLEKHPELGRAKDSSGDYAIHKACSNGNVAAIRALVPFSKQALSKPGAIGWPPLHLACLNGKAETAMVLLDSIESAHGAAAAANAVTHRSNGRSVTPLQVVCARGEPASAAVLAIVTRGAPLGGPAAADADGMQPAHWAAAHGNSSCLMHLANAA